MAALLVAMSVMAVLMTAAMPVWKQTAQREKETELVFRGMQYVHAIQLYQRRAGPGTYPPSLDFLVEQKFLRKRFKDPITGADFVPVPALAPGVPGATPGSVPGQPGSGPGSAAGSAGGRGSTTAPQPVVGPGGAVAGGVAGVVSKSTDKSIRVFNGQTHYNEWVFRALAQSPAGGPGGGGRGAPGPGAPGQPQGPGRGGPGPGGQRGPQRGGPGDGRGRFGPGFPPPGGGPNGRGANPAGRGFTVLPNGQVVPANPPGR
jgi:type II secretory pathway pseudopilin PulG